MKNFPLLTTETWFQALGLWEQNALLLIGVVAVAIFSYWLTNAVLLKKIYKGVKASKTNVDDELVSVGFFKKVTQIIPVIIIQWGAEWMQAREFEFLDAAWILRFAEAYFIIAVVRIVFALIDFTELQLVNKKMSKSVPVRSFVQVLKILLTLIGIIFLISVLTKVETMEIFASLGAVTAIILLIFKDSILGLVAGIQIAMNDLVRNGDWIDLPKYGASGDVVEVALTTVKVRNFDKTITSIPTVALITEGFKNWRGMASSGVRRIKRSVSIDLKTVSFLEEGELEKLKKIPRLQKYLEKKSNEVCVKANPETPHDCLENRRLTNLGTFRAYLVGYLSEHPLIDDASTLLVRQMSPTPEGVPIEVYAFSKDNRWAEYEDLQADIFDHIYAILPSFRLSVYQQPTGNFGQE